MTCQALFTTDFVLLQNRPCLLQNRPCLIQKPRRISSCLQSLIFRADVIFSLLKLSALPCLLQSGHHIPSFLKSLGHTKALRSADDIGILLYTYTDRLRHRHSVCVCVCVCVSCYTRIGIDIDIEGYRYTEFGGIRCITCSISCIAVFGGIRCIRCIACSIICVACSTPSLLCL